MLDRAAVQHAIGRAALSERVLMMVVGGAKLLGGVCVCVGGGGLYGRPRAKG